MARTIQSVPELYTDEIVNLGGGAYEVSFHLRAVFEGGDPAGEWHYYGTTPGPEHPDAVTHPATHFPAMMTMLPGGEGQELLYDLATQAERLALEA